MLIKIYAKIAYRLKNMLVLHYQFNKNTNDDNIFSAH